MSLQSERPIEYNLEEIEEATNNFDETRGIGIGGYGSVFYGMLGKKVYIHTPTMHVDPLNICSLKTVQLFNYRKLL